jgi:spore coat polysaccharide biosynthesis predicted glycosyltransferase SpsG
MDSHVLRIEFDVARIKSRIKKNVLDLKDLLITMSVTSVKALCKLVLTVSDQKNNFILSGVHGQD